MGVTQSEKLRCGVLQSLQYVISQEDTHVHTHITLVSSPLASHMGDDDDCLCIKIRLGT